MVSNSRPQKRKLPQGIDRYGEKFRSRVSYAGVQYLVGYYFTLADAKAALAIARSEIARGTFIPPTEKRRRQREEARRARQQAERDQRTVRELTDDWIGWLERRGRKLGTIYTYERQLESNFLNEFGERSPTSIEAQEIDKWYTQLAEGTTQRNAAGVYRTVASMFRYAAGTAQGLPEDFDR